MLKDVIVIGSGPAGLFFAAEAGKRGRQVLILERNDRPGKKLLATGNGRCNYSNRNISINRYHGENPDFAISALERLGSSDLIDIFDQMGMMTRELSKGRLYPRSLESSSVLDLLLLEGERYGVEIHYDTVVEEVKKDEYFIIETSSGVYKSKSLVLATGGTSLCRSGSDGLGYQLAKGLGHRLTDLGPGIVQINLVGDSQRPMEGVRFEGGLSLYRGDEFVISDEDEILFTSYGISGPAVLQLSRRALDVLKEDRAYFKVDFFPELDQEQLAVDLSYRFAMAGWKMLNQALISLVPRKCVKLLSQGFNSGPVGEMSYDDCVKLAGQLKALSFEIEGAYSMDSAQVTAGGVATDEVDPRTMESLKCKGLYLIGEILDIDGDCGGFNIHWAFASAYACAEGIGGIDV